MTNETTYWLTRAVADRVIPMEPRLETDADWLTEALNQGVLGFEDPKRKDFYTVARPGTDLYLHLHDLNRTIYLLARIPAAEAEPVGPLDDCADQPELTSCPS